jgi:GR25 family glycosyltransferase involved in LPS biosynthesis
MNINEYFDKIYCINLPERKDRWQQCEGEFKKHNINVVRYDGKRGQQTGRLTPGEVGLILTNIQILQEAVANNYEKILIMEDDVVFVDDFNKKFEEKIGFLPNNWGTIHLGGNHHFHMGKFKCISKEIDFELDRNNYKQLDYEICKTCWSQTTHAVGIHKSMYQLLLANFLSFTNQLDIVYCALQRSQQFETYAFIPSLVLQRASFSDIQNRVVDYNNKLHFF